MQLKRHQLFAIILAGLVGTGAFAVVNGLHDRSDGRRDISLRSHSAASVTNPSQVPFGMSGNVSSLYPGGSTSLDISFSNPHEFPIQVTSVIVGVSGSNVGCPSTNLVVRQLSGSPSIIVPKKGETSLSKLRIDVGLWPVLEFTDSGSNQNPCKGVQFAVSYVGLATKT